MTDCFLQSVMGFSQFIMKQLEINWDPPLGRKYLREVWGGWDFWGFGVWHPRKIDPRTPVVHPGRIRPLRCFWFLRRPLFPGSSESDQFLALQSGRQGVEFLRELFFGDEFIGTS